MHLKMLLSLFIQKVLWSEETCSKHLWIQFLEAIFINNMKDWTGIYLELKLTNKLKYFVLLSSNMSLCSHLHKKKNIIKKKYILDYMKSLYSKEKPLVNIQNANRFPHCDFKYQDW